jgi:hypothetical protein
LKSHPGKGLNLHEKVDEYGGHDVLWSQLCEANDAMEIFKDIDDQGNMYILMANRPKHSFDVAMADYKEG